MVLRWLFGSSGGGGGGGGSGGDGGGGGESDNASAAAAEDDEYAGPAEQETGSGDSAPAAGPGAETSGSLAVPLTAIPSFMVDDRPELRLSPYDLGRSQYAANVLALTHNAVRLEMADMWGDILPSLQSRCEDGAETGLAPEDAVDIRNWWSGFARFALTASLVDDMVAKKAFADVYVGFDKETKNIEKLFQKVQEKNNVHLEMAVRKMAKSVQQFEDDITTAGFTTLVKAWQLLASILADIYAESEALVAAIDTWIREPFEYKELEKQAAKIFTNKKRWGEDDSKRGEMIVILCRWVGTEELMREWMFRNLTKRELRSIDKWMDDYRDRRLAIIDRFHQKKV